MMLIPVYRKGEVVAWSRVDDADYERFGGVRWHLSSGGYASRHWPEQGCRNNLLHRLVLGLQFGDKRQADHINRDRLDNRRSNLRIVSHADNLRNIGSKPGSTSSYRGVSWRDRRSPWSAQGHFDGISHHLGSFSSEIDAALAVNDFWTRLGYDAPNEVPSDKCKEMTR